MAGEAHEPMRAVTWREFELAAPSLAEFGARRLAVGASYLATVRADGSARVHPVNPKVMAGHLVLYMFPTSPKAADVGRDPRFALHAAVDDVNGAGGEFAVRGVARAVGDDDLGDEIASAGSPPREGYVRFELLVHSVLVGTYAEGSNVPRIRQWQLAPDRGQR
jgi:Pyridoxamine 5'-phosphate oxidase